MCLSQFDVFFQMKHDVQRFPTWDCVRSMSFYPKAPHPAAHVPLRPWHLAAPHLTRCCRVAFSRDAATWGFSWCTTAMGNRGGDHRNSRDIHVASPDVFFCFECQVKPRSWHSYSVVFISFHNISYHFISFRIYYINSYNLSYHLSSCHISQDHCHPWSKNFPPVFSAWLKDLDVCGGFPYCGIGVPGDLGLGEKNIVEKNGRTVFFFFLWTFMGN